MECDQKGLDKLEDAPHELFPEFGGPSRQHC